MNKKGFTLVEVLAVIALIAIILVAAIPGVYKIREKMDINAQEKIEDNIKVAAKQYAKSQINSLKTSNNCQNKNSCEIYLPINELIDNGFYSDENLTKTDDCDYLETSTNKCLNDIPIKISINAETVSVSISNSSKIAMEDAQNMGWEYIKNESDKTASIVAPDGSRRSAYNGNETTVVVPSYIGDYKVTSIGKDAFFMQKNIKKIILPDTITSIGWEAFSNCSSLESINIPKSVKSISGYAFEYCYNLKNIYIPSSLTSFSIDIFIGATNLKAINVDENNPVYRSKDGVIFSKDMRELIFHPAKSSEGTYTIPDSVTTIKFRAFHDTKLDSIIIGENVKKFETEAFGSSQIKNIYLNSSSIESISDRVFHYQSINNTIYVKNSNVYSKINSSNYVDFSKTKVIMQ